MPSPCPPHPPRPSVYCTCYPGNPMGRMQIRGTNETDPHLPSQFTLMMTNTFVHGEGRWEFQYASNHCSPQISPSLLLSKPLTYLFSFLSFHLSNTFPLSPAQYLHLRTIHFSFIQFLLFSFSAVHSGITARATKLACSRWRLWFARGQCYLNRPIGLFALAPSIRREALRNQPITSISHGSIQ